MAKLKQLEDILREKKLLRVGDLRELKFPRSYLSELERRGLAVREACGVYRHPEAEVPGYYSHALACKQVPGSVICLLSALAFHEIGTQNPHEVWIAVDRRARLPKVDYPPLRVVRFSGAALTEGIEETGAEFRVRVYCPAKTVADCFKYRNKFDTDVAVEGLREGWRNRRFSIDKLNHYARICRVEKIITPNLEAIL
jgi:predicted transcriptional regulator of viral defense system